MQTTRRSFSPVRLVALLLLAAAPLLAQGKKPITQETYDLWRTIPGATLSADGRFAMYTLSHSWATAMS